MCIVILTKIFEFIGIIVWYNVIPSPTSLLDPLYARYGQYQRVWQCRLRGSLRQLPGSKNSRSIIRGNFLGPCMTSVMSNYEVKDCDGSDKDLMDLLLSLSCNRCLRACWWEWETTKEVKVDSQAIGLGGAFEDASSRGSNWQDVSNINRCV